MSDHSLVAEMVRGGRLTEEEAAVHPHRSVLSRALGTESAVRFDEFAVDLRVGDVLLLCSDGLSGPVAAPAMARALTLRDVDEAARTLIHEARRQGGPDNITALVLRFEAASAEGAQAQAEAAAAAAGDTAPDPGSTDPSPDADSSTADPPERSAAGAARPRHRGMMILAVFLAFLVVAGLAGGVIISSVFYVTVDEGRLAVFSGLPIEIGPVPLHAVYRSSSRRTRCSRTQARASSTPAVCTARMMPWLGRDLGMWP